VDRDHPNVRLAPRVASKGGADSILGVGLDGERHAVTIDKGPAEDHNPGLRQVIHE
jgi:hypothetical protein